jgi:hypothetical protein
MNSFKFHARASAKALLLLSCSIMLFNACVGYRIGSMLPEKYNTVAVPTFINRTGEPLLENPTTSAAIAEIQTDGSLKVADAADADLLLKAVLENFIIRPIAYSDERARLASEYRMEIEVSFVMTDRLTGEVVVEADKVQGYADFIVAGDMSSSKQTALPDASQDLAHKIVERLVEVW